MSVNESHPDVIVRRLVGGDQLILFTIEGDRVLVLEMRHGRLEEARPDKLF
ncbi:MAG: hypothetical protein SGI72_13765 [Planctomycetota bacterium]|nr:hypothetical protein [Planctomycetota bacterium]